MGKFAHILVAASLMLVLAAPAARADTPDDPLRFFADCVGRLSAELSFRWMMSDPSADQIEDLRRNTLQILMALTPVGEGRTVLSWRTAARSAHSALLTRATFSEDPWASDRADQEIAYCAHFVLGAPTSGSEIAAIPSGLVRATRVTTP